MKEESKEEIKDHWDLNIYAESSNIIFTNKKVKKELKINNEIFKTNGIVNEKRATYNFGIKF